MSSRFNRAWRNEAWRFGLAVVIALAVGWWLHAIAACVLIVAAAWLAFAAFRTLQFGRWLESGQRTPDASGSGLTAEMQYLVARRRQGSFNEKRHLVGLLRAFRDAAAAL